MNMLNDWMQSDWVKALGWTFVHSLWQIALTGLILYIILRLIPGRSAHVRYTIATMAIWLIVVMSISTFIIMLPANHAITEISGNVVLIATTSTLSLPQKISLWLEAYMPMMLTVWLGGVMILMVRLLFSLAWVGHMRQVATVSNELQQSLDDIINRLRLKVKPVVSESIHVASPVTLGHLKPIILFPIGIVNQLTPSEVEAVLTHELAHIVRRDYLSNVIQSFIETLFYYHPVTWWISGVVRTERENRADDLAISWCGDHFGYAKALMTVQEMQIAHRPVLTIGFASRKGAMLARIQRILHIPYKNHNQMEKTVLLSLCSLCFLAFTLTSDAKNDQQNLATKERIELNAFQSMVDTIPTEGTYRIHKKTDEQEINIEVEDGNIKQLKIDGKEIKPEEFGRYDDIIVELFGEMEAPPAPHGFNFEMQGMPALPPLPEMNGVMPPMPPMPPMGEMDFKHFFNESNRIALGNGRNFETKFFTDSSGNSQIIIINADGDSNIIVTPGGHHYRFFTPDAMGSSAYIIEAEEWAKKYADDWKKHSEQWEQHGEQWEQHGEEWKKMAETWQQEWENNAHEWESRGEAMEELRKHLKEERIYELRDGQLKLERQDFHGLDDVRQLEGMGLGHVYGLMPSRMNMTDAMIEEGLIDRGDEATIQLTPDKLKINGKKMDDETHKKYLRMYESQQGIELTGNSRVEFKTKSRRSM